MRFVLSGTRNLSQTAYATDAPLRRFVRPSLFQERGVSQKVTAVSIETGQNGVNMEAAGLLLYFRPPAANVPSEVTR